MRLKQNVQKLEIQSISRGGASLYNDESRNNILMVLEYQLISYGSDLDYYNLK